MPINAYSSVLYLTTIHALRTGLIMTLGGYGTQLICMQLLWIQDYTCDKRVPLMIAGAGCLVSGSNITFCLLPRLSHHQNKVCNPAKVQLSNKLALHQII